MTETPRAYVWIVTQYADGITATVVRQCQTRAEAETVAMRSTMADVGFEGPVPADMYPIGKRFPITDDDGAAL